VLLLWPLIAQVTEPPALPATPPTLNGAPAAPAPAQPLKKISPTASVLLSLGQRQITVMDNGRVIGGPWPVAVGAKESPTPKGTFSVLNKVVNPIYRSTHTDTVNPKRGQESPLGERWVGFLKKDRDQFGIHGTPWPFWVNRRLAVTNGCVRMLNQHVREMFDLVDVGAVVQITD
jgi:lipoprotein-anchoring transpeptidase ErfK/SrfK